MLDDVQLFPHFAVVCRMKRPTAGSVGLFVVTPRSLRGAALGPAAEVGADDVERVLEGCGRTLVVVPAVADAHDGLGGRESPPPPPAAEAAEAIVAVPRPASGYLTVSSRLPGLWSRRPRVRVPSLTLFAPANDDRLCCGRSSAGQTRGKFGPAKPPWRARCRSRRPRCRAEYRSAASGMHGVVSRRPVGSRRSA
jgi:hypothetical protein